MEDGIKMSVYVLLLFINWKKNSSISSSVVKTVEITLLVPIKKSL